MKDEAHALHKGEGKLAPVHGGEHPSQCIGHRFRREDRRSVAGRYWSVGGGGLQRGLVADDRGRVRCALQVLTRCQGHLAPCDSLAPSSPPCSSSWGNTRSPYYFQISDPASDFGAAAGLMSLLLWAYYRSHIFFLGAEFSYVWAREHGRRVVPTDEAVHVVQQDFVMVDGRVVSATSTAQKIGRIWAKCGGEHLRGAATFGPHSNDDHAYRTIPGSPQRGHERRDAP